MKLFAEALVVYISIIFSPLYCAQEIEKKDSDAALALVAFSSALEQEKANEWQVIQIFRSTMNKAEHRSYEPIIQAMINYKGSTSNLEKIIRLEKDALSFRCAKLNISKTNFERALKDAFRIRENKLKRKKLINSKRSFK